MRLATFIVAVAGFALAGCVGNTGGQTFTFPAAAAGPADATGGALAFSTGGFDVTLSAATLHVGAVYLNQAAPVSGAQATDCYLTGTYVGEVPCALDVDLLNGTAQPFTSCPTLSVTEPPALAEQVWLTGGDINDPSDTTTILSIAGTATGATDTFAFSGTVTIGPNHTPSGNVTGGGDSICKQRIVSPIRQAITIAPTGGLLLRIDPRLFFVDVDLGQLPADAATGDRVFSDDPGATGYFPTGQNLYANLRSVAPYTFSWEGTP
jgi:hypothetical protein